MSEAEGKYSYAKTFKASGTDMMEAIHDMERQMGFAGVITDKALIEMRKRPLDKKLKKELR
ncbi:MAG: hypothetical protein KGH57_02620 [Candidatus Micrarchaeota archaeon]|nr:hypothetical protein [Candidatus Micrarchaeota archaeon]